MISSTEFVVISGLLLTLILICLPLTFAGIRLFLPTACQIRTNPFSFVDRYLNSYYTAEYGLQQRKEVRTVLPEDLVVELSDNDGSLASGLVVNISKEGLCVQDFSNQLSTSFERIGIVIRNQQKYLKIEGTPCWHQKDVNSSQLIGLSVYPVAMKCLHATLTN